MNTTQPDPLAVKCLIDLMVLNRATGSYEATFQTKAHIIISNYLARARQEADTAECDALKASNAELREQHVASAKFISELQHTIRLVQGTHAQQVRKCAEKAATALEASPYGESWRYVAGSKHAVLGIICEAFGAPVNEYEDALQKAWEARRALGNAPHFVDFRDGFHAAWKLAKGKP